MFYILNDKAEEFICRMYIDDPINRKKTPRREVYYLEIQFSF